MASTAIRVMSAVGRLGTWNKMTSYGKMGEHAPPLLSLLKAPAKTRAQSRFDFEGARKPYPKPKVSAQRAPLPRSLPKVFPRRHLPTKVPLKVSPLKVSPLRSQSLSQRSSVDLPTPRFLPKVSLQGYPKAFVKRARAENPVEPMCYRKR